MAATKHHGKIRLLKNKSPQISWQTYDRDMGWVTQGHLRNAILNHCKFATPESPDQPPQYIFCDTFYDVSLPMKRTVTLFGTIINRSSESYECGGIPISKCDQVILMEGQFYKIA